MACDVIPTDTTACNDCVSELLQWCWLGRILSIQSFRYRWAALFCVAYYTTDFSAVAHSAKQMLNDHSDSAERSVQSLCLLMYGAHITNSTDVLLLQVVQ